jgi:hypothetical protein
MRIGRKPFPLDLDDAGKNKGSPNQIAGVDDDELNKEKGFEPFHGCWVLGEGLNQACCFA